MDRSDAVWLENWTAQRLAVLAADGSWQPNVAKALERFRDRRAAMGRRRFSLGTRAFAIVAFAGLCVAVLLAPNSWVRRGLGEPGMLWRGVFEPRSVGASTLIPQKDRKPAAAFTLTDAAHKPIALADFKGKVVLLNFWATWCHGCVQEVPWFVEFDNTYRSKGLAVIGVSMDDGWSAVNPFVAKERVKYAIVLDNSEVSRRYSLNAMPMTVLIDRQGKVAATHVGVVSRDDCQAEIDSLLLEKP